jgi:RpiR family carbohydrate utilization transcriptional regulator
MSVRSSIQGSYRDLRPTQRRIADYLLSLDFDGLNAPIDEYARRIGTSIASISRFCARIGYDSFQMLKIALSREMQAPADTVLPVFAAGDDPRLSIRKVFAEAIANLQATEAAVSFPALLAVAERVARAERLYFLGLGGSGGVGSLSEVMFAGLGFNAKALSDPYGMLLCAGHVHRSHLVFGLSHSGSTREVVQAVRAARERGAFTVGITNYPRSPLAEAVHAALITSCHEHRVHFAQSNSMAAQLTLIRALYILVASRISPEALQEVNRIEQAVNRSLRLKTKRGKTTHQGAKRP